MQLQVLYEDALKREKLSVLVDSFIENQLSTGNNEKYVRQQEKHLKKVFDYCKWITIDEVNIEGFEEWRSKVPITANTKNHYQATLSCFCQWAFVRKYINENPFKRCKKIRVFEPSQNRRALRKEEIIRLLHNSTNPILYALALATGLRKGELEKLKWCDIDFIRENVRARSSISKNRKLAYLPLSYDLIKKLKKFKGGANSQDLVFGRIAEKWKKDYSNCNIEIYGVNERCDFHSLRKTYLTYLVLGGLHPRIVQELARHSNYNLTAKLYTDVGLLDTKASLDIISPLLRF